jgi:hypothetical protein
LNAFLIELPVFLAPSLTAFVVLSTALVVSLTAVFATLVVC